MIAIFNIEQDAIDYSDKIHTHLTANRPGYNATRWSAVNKSDDANEWAVKMPYDLAKLKVSMKAVDLGKSTKQISKYPDKWRVEDIGRISDIKMIK